MQSAQILLSRLQIQEVAVTSASQHLDDARSKLAEVQVVMKSEAAEIKHFEDAPNNGDNAAQVEAALNRAKSDLEASTNLAQQRSRRNRCRTAAAHGAGQTEQASEPQLDELVRNLENPGQQLGRVPQ